ncbi:F-box domain-containing protein [Brazilian cedratvirus IHUMI]|uniref:F-box domain-containing protein n=1 Tax=Brazilian cedratvirus IHUMI TaxID=2126980 RepID=A0A2R8FFP6_9VIRU|nr:F-box domain-containing protein [Brazilian cedratvirus IHUMI]
MLEVDGTQIYQLALTSRCMTNILSDSYFWKRRYQREGLYPVEGETNDVVSRLHSYTIACKIKKRLCILDREQSFPQMFICARKYSTEELRFIFFFRPELLLSNTDSYRLTLGVNSNKEFYFAIESYREIAGSGFLLRHNLQNTLIKNSCSALEMRKLLYRCYSL